MPPLSPSSSVSFAAQPAPSSPPRPAFIACSSGSPIRSGKNDRTRPAIRKPMPIRSRVCPILFFLIRFPDTFFTFTGIPSASIFLSLCTFKTRKSVLKNQAAINSLYRITAGRSSMNERTGYRRKWVDEKKESTAMNAQSTARKTKSFLIFFSSILREKLSTIRSV